MNERDRELIRIAREQTILEISLLLDLSEAQRDVLWRELKRAALRRCATGEGS